MMGLVVRDGTVRLERALDEPIPAEGEVLLRVCLAGICATDLELAKGYLSFAGVPGHEFVARVHAPELPEWHGRRVVGGINCGCGRCDLCREGMERHCPDRTVLGIVGRPGTLAERAVLPLKNLVPVPEGVSDEDAVFAEPLAAVLRMAEQTRITAGDRVAVVGDGKMGLLAVLAGEALGWKTALVGKHPGRAKRFFPSIPFFAPGEAPAAAFDVVAECSGSPGGLEEGLRLLRPMGRLLLKTTVAEGGKVDLTPLVVNEIEVIGSRCGDPASAVRLLASGKVHPSRFVSKRYPLERGVEAFRAAGEKEMLKVLVEMPQT